MKILYITTVCGTMLFFKKFINELIQEGHTVDIATHESEKSKVAECYREWGCKVYQISTSRSPLNRGNIAAVNQIKKIVSENDYEMVHCHTPIAAACTRLACRSLRKKGVKVFYTAHGFHFYQGAPLKNWLIYYTVEKICARWTDVLITINTEDYELAKKKLKAGRVEYVPGVGIDVSRFADASVDIAAKREEIGVPQDAFMLLSVGELNENKNHETVIKALAELGDSNIHYVIAGKGGKKEYLEELAKEKGVNLHMLGYRKDITELNKTADVFILPSYREGLCVSVMEAMAAGLPVICGKIRGNVDLIEENGGILFNPIDVAECAKAIREIKNCDLQMLGNYNRNKVNIFAEANIHSLMWNLYMNI